MSDIVNSFLVVIERDLTVEQALAVKNAIMMIKDVIDIIPNATDYNTHIGYIRAKYEIRKKLAIIIEKELQ